jgi:hypothetical protein
VTFTIDEIKVCHAKRWDSPAGKAQWTHNRLAFG